MKLITEEVQKVKFITEGKGANKKMYIEGVFLQGDIKNRNGRLYPVSTLASCLLYTSPSPRDKHRSRMPSSA